jgi:hypothetical protein
VDERPGCRSLDPPDLARALCGMSARAQVLDWALRHDVAVDEYERRAARNLVWLVIVLAVLGLGIALFLSAAESSY